jgi:beta-mannosidase
MISSSTPETVIDLAGLWRLTSLEGDHTTDLTVPGDVHSALKNAGIIPDPYHGANENAVQWVAHRDWIMERTFILDDADASWYVDIDYLDTVAIVFVNDVPVLS